MTISEVNYYLAVPTILKLFDNIKFILLHISKNNFSKDIVNSLRQYVVTIVKSIIDIGVKSHHIYFEQQIRDKFSAVYSTYLFYVFDNECFIHIVIMLGFNHLRFKLQVASSSVSRLGSFGFAKNYQFFFTCLHELRFVCMYVNVPHLSQTFARKRRGDNRFNIESEYNITCQRSFQNL